MRIWGLVVLFVLIGVGISWISDAGAAMSEAQRKEDARKRSQATFQQANASLLSVQAALEEKRGVEKKLRTEVDKLKVRATKAEDARNAAIDELATMDVVFCPEGSMISIPVTDQ